MERVQINPAMVAIIIPTLLLFISGGAIAEDTVTSQLDDENTSIESGSVINKQETGRILIEVNDSSNGVDEVSKNITIRSSDEVSDPIDSTPDVISSLPKEYKSVTNSQQEVDFTGLSRAAADFRDEKIGFRMLSDVAEGFRKS